jgi:hypothetical protein
MNIVVSARGEYDQRPLTQECANANLAYSEAVRLMPLASEVTVTFRDVDDVEAFASVNVEDDGWLGPEDVKKVISKLGDEHLYASQQMTSADNGEAAREWATRMRACEKAILELKRLVGGL